MIPPFFQKKLLYRRYNIYPHNKVKKTLFFLKKRKQKDFYEKKENTFSLFFEKILHILKNYTRKEFFEKKKEGSHYLCFLNFAQ